MMQNDGGRLYGALCVAVVAALLVIGAVSHEVKRHIIQAGPAMIAAALAFAGARWAKWAAAPVFVVWLAIPVLIWLFLAGVSNIANGTYTPAEIAMTVVLATASAFGLARIAMRPGGAHWLVAALSVLVFAAAQISVMAISFQPAFAHD